MRQRTVHSPSQMQSASESGASLAPYAAVVERAQDMFGGALAGVVAFGSWMRGEMTNESDIDALVVLDPGVRLTRRLTVVTRSAQRFYRRRPTSYFWATTKG